MPEAFQRMPPRSQTDRAKPHEHRTIHERESASIDSAQRRGRTAAKILWIQLIAVQVLTSLRLSRDRVYPRWGRKAVIPPQWPSR